MAVLIAGCGGEAETPEPVASATATATAAPAPTAIVATPTAVPTMIPTTAPPTPVPATPTATAPPTGWWTVGQETWDDTFEVTLEIFGPSTITSGTELRARSTLRNVSGEPAQYVRWSQDDAAVPLWIVLPSGPPPADPTQRQVVRLIQLWADDDPEPSLSSFPQVQTDTLEAGGTIEREVSWDLTVRGETAGSQVAAPDGVYTARADLYPREGQVLPGQPDLLVEFEFTLERG